MPIKVKYETMDEVPEAHRELYEETESGVLLTGVEGMKTDADVAKIQEALRKERQDHKDSKSRLQKFGDLDPDDVFAKLDRIEELEKLAEGNTDDAKIEEAVDKRLKSKTAPLERQIQNLTTERDEVVQERDRLNGQIVDRDRGDAVRQVAQKMNIRSEAIPDLELTAERFLEQSEDGSFVVREDARGLTPGLDLEGFVRSMKESRPHWWPESKGGGANGGNGGGDGGGDNPFSAKGWNVTSQGKMLREDPERANRLAKSAGTTVGGTRPK